MKVVHVINSLTQGGAQSMLVNLVTHQKDRNLEQVVISLIDGGVNVERLQAKGIKMYSLGLSRKRQLPFMMAKLIRIMQLEKPDVVVSWLYWTDFCMLIAKWIMRFPVLVWNVRCSQMKDLKKCFFKRTIIRFLTFFSKQPQTIIFNSKAGRACHQSYGYHMDKAVLIANGFDTAIFKPDASAKQSVCEEFGLADDTFLIGCMARFHPMKDHETLFKALNQIDKNYKVLLAGDHIHADNQDLAALIQNYNLQDKVLLLGCRQDVARLYGALDLFVLPSAYGEGFPNVVGEAMACGAATIATDVGDSAYLVGKAGTVIAPKDVEALTHAIQNYMQDEDLRMKHGHDARQRILDEFSLDRILSQYERLYPALVKPATDTAATTVET